MVKNTSRIETRVSTSTKTRWENFLLSHHSTVRGSYGPELERAMNQYMDTFSSNSDVYVETKMHKRKLDGLKLISSRFRDIPTYPVITPQIIDSVIKNCMPKVTRRTFLTYKQEVLDHKKEHPSDGMIPKFNIQIFCEYVDRLTNESFLK